MNIILGSQWYPWYQRYADVGKKVDDHLDEVFQQVKEAGLQAWEQTITTEKEVVILSSLLKKHDLIMPSTYVGGRLHDANANKTIEEIIRQAKLARELGAFIVVCNPDPISWEDKVNKSDEQLQIQASALDEIANRLFDLGMKFAYHTHEPEMRCGAREFHHMLLGTKSKNIGFCLDVHWIYRGCENSQIALEDILNLYGSKIVSLHLRQSSGGVWTEHLQNGDVDFYPVVECLKKNAFSGPAIIETAFEMGTPKIMSMTESHLRSKKWLNSIGI